jgi:hypothetical protein
MRRIVESSFDDAFSLAWQDLHLAPSRRDDSWADQAAWRAHRCTCSCVSTCRPTIQKIRLVASDAFSLKHSRTAISAPFSRPR